MKHTCYLIAAVCMLSFTNIFMGKAQVPSPEKDATSTLPKDATLKEPTPEELDNLDIKVAQKLTTLKYNPSTKKIKVSYPSDNTGLVAEATLYYNSARLIRLEKYVYDQSKKQVSYSMFNFNEKNACISNDQWNIMDANKRVLTTSEYGLIYFGSNMQLIELESDQMQKLIQETKDSLDALMGHFKNFKYTFEIR